MTRGGQEKVDGNAVGGTPAAEAGEATNDMQVDLVGPPPSGSGGVYPTVEISSDLVADSRGNVVGQATDPGTYAGDR